MGKLMEVLQREDGCLSLARLLALIIFLVWLGITIGTFVLSKSYSHYDTLSCCMLVSVISCIAGKYVDCKLLSVKGGA